MLRECHNGSLKRDGDLHKDLKSAFNSRLENHLLLTFTQNSPALKMQVKNLRSAVLYTHSIAKR